MNWDTNMALWHVTHADGRSAVVRAESGPLAMQMLGWHKARFEMLAVAGEAQVIMTAAAPTPGHDYQRYIEVLNEEGRPKEAVGEMNGVGFDTVRGMMLRAATCFRTDVRPDLVRDALGES